MAVLRDYACICCDSVTEAIGGPVMCMHCDTCGDMTGHHAVINGGCRIRHGSARRVWSSDPEDYRGQVRIKGTWANEIDDDTCSSGRYAEQNSERSERRRWAHRRSVVGQKKIIFT